ALPSSVRPAPTIATLTLPLTGPEILVEVGTLRVLPVATKLLDAEAGVLARLADGVELETGYVCVAVAEPMLEAGNLTTYVPPTADIGTFKAAVLSSVNVNPRNVMVKVHGLVTSRTAEPSSVAPAGPERTCQRQVVGLPLVPTASGVSVVLPAKMPPSP